MFRTLVLCVIIIIFQLKPWASNMRSSFQLPLVFLLSTTSTSISRWIYFEVRGVLITGDSQPIWITRFTIFQRQHGSFLKRPPVYTPPGIDHRGLRGFKTMTGIFHCSLLQDTLFSSKARCAMRTADLFVHSGLNCPSLSNVHYCLPLGPEENWKQRGFHKRITLRIYTKERVRGKIWWHTDARMSMEGKRARISRTARSPVLIQPNVDLWHWEIYISPDIDIYIYHSTAAAAFETSSWRLSDALHRCACTNSRGARHCKPPEHKVDRNRNSQVLPAHTMRTPYRDQPFIIDLGKGMRLNLLHCANYWRYTGIRYSPL